MQCSYRLLPPQPLAPLHHTYISGFQLHTWITDTILTQLTTTTAHWQHSSDLLQLCCWRPNAFNWWRSLCNPLVSISFFYNKQHSAYAVPIVHIILLCQIYHGFPAMHTAIQYAGWTKQFLMYTTNSSTTAPSYEYSAHITTITRIDDSPKQIYQIALFNAVTQNSKGFTQFEKPTATHSTWHHWLHAEFHDGHFIPNRYSHSTK